MAGTKQVRVDNWGIFFLQKLQMFFSKTDHCDLTLQFDGNVQLKVHRLVMHACTEYFQVLEENCGSDDNVILMPSHLQADVIVPIVNFMYTGMLEFQTATFQKLYRAADLMNITILTKLLDAQINSVMTKNANRKMELNPIMKRNVTPVRTCISGMVDRDLLPLPVRKPLNPTWKRKLTPGSHLSPNNSSSSSSSQFVPSDPLSLPEATPPKPTRFEWPEDDLPIPNPSETNFEDISYTSKPLLTKDEEVRASTSFDDMRSTSSSNVGQSSTKKNHNLNMDIEDMKDYLKEQKIRSDFVAMDEDSEHEGSTKRKPSESKAEGSPKRVKFSDKEKDKENVKETVINVTAPKGNGSEYDHTKIVTEILKKYPHLVKKNKNIRLKIMAPGSKTVAEEVLVQTSMGEESSPEPVKQPKPSPTKLKPQLASQVKETTQNTTNSMEGPWKCSYCDSPEFILYYLYRKHLIDEHEVVFDANQCRYCDIKCKTFNLLNYHLYTRHALKPNASQPCKFPRCDKCPFMGLTQNHLQNHKSKHLKAEAQCVGCKLSFNCAASLTKHLQTTCHKLKQQSVFDCPYCAKRFSNSTNLYSHLSSVHVAAAKRDGIVLLDDGDAEKYDEELIAKNQDEEYVPEMVPQKEKVNIISNVKVTGSHLQQATSVAMQQNNMNNVGGDLATSLGLVDIVVLNDNQQYILQQPQQQQAGQEYILPGHNTFPSQVITTQHNTLPTTIGSDIASTDELVMVLTDHDYNDADNANGTQNNSNIVVLYSHPVSGQQGQYIASPGNLIVDSQTGLFEIHNPTTAEGHVVMNHPHHEQIESIELIQREIESHSEMKAETYYNNSQEVAAQSQETELKQDEAEPAQTETVTEPIAEESSEANKENVSEVLSEEHKEEVKLDEAKLGDSALTEQTSTKLNEEASIKEEEENAIEQPSLESTASESLSLPILDETDKPQQHEDQQEEIEVEFNSSLLTENCTLNDSSISDIPPEEPMDLDLPLLQEEMGKKSENSLPQLLQEEPQETVSKSEEQPELKQGEDVPPTIKERDTATPTLDEPPSPTEQLNSEEPNKEPATLPEISQYVPESMEVDGRVPQQEDPQTEPPKETTKLDPQESTNEPSETHQTTELSQESSRKGEQEQSQAAKISILDDWDDTDSQQSGGAHAAQNETNKETTILDESLPTQDPEETVNKLMDDWDDEEDDENRKQNVVAQ